ncbi:DMT family transporter [Marinomonas algicola]|uniref:DMT family transporter n=1 Tax=Marinomonas algicola TaxID=2773454 RepID=UPI00174DCDF4|nr:DMT family transporter [Marinomonas algicola]
MTNHSQSRGEFVLVLVTVLAAFGWVFSKEAIASFPPLLFMGIRFFIAGIILVLLGKRFFRGLDKESVKKAVLVGAVGSASMGFWISGLDHSDHLGVGAFIMSLGAILTPIMAKFIFGAKPTRSIWVASCIAMLGLGCLSLSNGLDFELSHLFFLASALSSAFQMNLMSRFTLNIHVLVLSSFQLMVTGAVLLCISFSFETMPETVSLEVIKWLLLSILIATSLRFFLQTYGLSLTPVSHAAILLNLEPVWTAILATFWFSEVMKMNQVLGCSLIFLAMLVSRWRQLIVFIKK